MTARAPAAGTISPGRRRRPPERDTPVTVQLPKDLAERIQRLAEVNDRNVQRWESDRAPRT
jgi:hypothetical protein